MTGSEIPPVVGLLSVADADAKRWNSAHAQAPPNLNMRESFEQLGGQPSK